MQEGALLPLYSVPLDGTDPAPLATVYAEDTPETPQRAALLRSLGVRIVPRGLGPLLAGSAPLLRTDGSDAEFVALVIRAVATIASGVADTSRVAP